MVLAVALNPLSVGVIANEAARREGELDLHGSKVTKNIVRAAAIRTRLAQDARKHVLGGVGIDDLNVVDDEIADGEDALARSFGHKN